VIRSDSASAGPAKIGSVPDGNRIQEIKVALANSAKDASLKNNLED
jgi:hypothetical protein